MLPLVSIIIPIYNAEKYISAAIGSVMSQSYSNWELIMVDDGSTDNSHSVALKFGSEKVKVYSQENKGASAARNYGFKQSKGEFIKFFDADDLLSEGMLEEQVNRLLENENCIASAQWGRFYNNDLNTFKLNPEECWQNMNALDWICSSWKNARSMTQPGIFLIPRKVIDRAGLWDERLSLIDDFEYFTRTILSASSIIFCPNSILYYRSGHSNNLSNKKSRKAVESAILSALLATNFLLKKLNNEATRRLSANSLMTLVYEFKLSYPDLISPVEERIKYLGGSDLKLKRGFIYNFVSSIIGWELANKYL